MSSGPDLVREAREGAASPRPVRDKVKLSTGNPHEPTYVNNRRLLRPREVAELLGCSRSAVYELVRRDVLPHIRLDGMVRIPAPELEEFIRARIRGGEPEEGDR